eukprot:COSAG06_NODE_23811_length_680_cov_320.363167_1_plen_206_part_01
MENDAHAVTHWLGDVPVDELVLNAGQVLGVDRLVSLADGAEGRGDWWLAGRYYTIACTLKSRAETIGDGLSLCKTALDALSRCSDWAKQAGPNALDDLHEVQLMMISRQMLAGDLPGIVARSSEVEVVLNSQAAERSPVTASVLRMFMGFPLLMAGDVNGFGTLVLTNTMAVRPAAESYPDPIVRHHCAMMMYGPYQFMEHAIMQP